MTRWGKSYGVRDENNKMVWFDDPVEAQVLENALLEKKYGKPTIRLESMRAYTMKGSDARFRKSRDR